MAVVVRVMRWSGWRGGQGPPVSWGAYERV